MWKTYRSIIRQYPKISLQGDRRLIRKAKKESKQAASELVLRHIGFVIFRIHKRAFPAYARRFGEDILSQAIVLMYAKIQTYNLRYYDEQWKFLRHTSLDGSVLRRKTSPVRILYLEIH
jgi:hypothetical protein